METSQLIPKFLLIVLIILSIYQYNKISDLKHNIKNLESEYSDLESDFDDLNDKYHKAQDELDEFKSCFEDESWSYCVNNYI